MTAFKRTFFRAWWVQTLLLACLLSGLWSCSAPVQHKTPLARGDIDAATQSLKKFIEQEMKASQVAGLSVALVSDQKLLWAQGFGWSDVQAHHAATPETLYRVGSISKLFTATAIMQLAEQGRLNLDAPVDQVLPEFQLQSRFKAAPPITPRHLLTHHAGLPRDIGHGMWTPHPVRFTEVTGLLRSQEASYPPQTAFAYSNLGFNVLGHAVERLAGQTFENHLAQRVLVPIGMVASSFTAAVPVDARMAKAYNKGQVASELALRDVPAGGLNTSVLDLGRFLSMMFAQGRVGDASVLQPSSVVQMWSVQNADVALDMDFRNGLGWMLSTLGEGSLQGAGTVAHHGGATINFHSQMYALPEKKLALVVLSNDAASGQAVNRIAVRAMELLLETQAGVSQPEKVKPVEATEPWSVHAMQAMEGDYTTALGHVRVFRQGDRLQTQALGRTFSLQPLQGEALGLRYKVLGLFPVSLGELDFIALSKRTVAGREVLLASSGGQNWLLGEKIKPPFVVAHPEQWVGRYEFLNRAADDPFQVEVSVEAVRGFFVVRINDPASPDTAPAVPVLPISETQAVMMGPLNAWGDVVSYQMVDGQQQLEFSGYVLRRRSN